MYKRIKEVRLKEGLSQQKFADKLGIARGNIAAYEVNKNAPSDAVISLISKEFNINETWLRTGEGEMYTEPSDDFMEIATLIDIKDPMAKKVIMEYWKLSDDDKELFWKFMERFIKN